MTEMAIPAIGPALSVEVDFGTVFLLLFVDFGVFDKEELNSEVPCVLLVLWDIVMAWVPLVKLVFFGTVSCTAQFWNETEVIMREK